MVETEKCIVCLDERKGRHLALAPQILRTVREANNRMYACVRKHIQTTNKVECLYFEAATFLELEAHRWVGVLAQTTVARLDQISSNLRASENAIQHVTPESIDSCCCWKCLAGLDVLALALQDLESELAPIMQLLALVGLALAAQALMRELAEHLLVS